MTLFGKDALPRKLFRDIPIVAIEIPSDVSTGEFSLVRPNDGVVPASPSQNLGGSGGVWKAADKRQFRIDGVVVLEQQG